MLAAAASFLKSADRRQIHEKASRGFRSLMVKMVSCELEKDYEKVWADFNREIMDEPIMPKKFVKKIKMKYTMTPELREV
jgi:transposase